MNKPLLNAAELEHLAEAGNATAGSTACACLPAQVAAWESVTKERWPDEVLQCIGTLRHPDIEEPTFEERHPSGTRYDSPHAPIAVAFFPFNRCDVFGPEFSVQPWLTFHPAAGSRCQINVAILLAAPRAPRAPRLFAVAPIWLLGPNKPFGALFDQSPQTIVPPSVAWCSRRSKKGTQTSFWECVFLRPNLECGHVD